MGLTWSHLFNQRAEATKITGGGGEESERWRTALKENEKMCTHFKPSFSGPQFIDSNKSCMS